MRLARENRKGLKPTKHCALWTGLDDDEIPGHGLYYGTGTSIDTMKL